MDNIGKYEAIYLHRGYSSHYGKQIDDLIAWFTNRIKDRAPIQLSEDEYRMGVDKLPDDLKELTKEAFSIWLNEKRYELSYNQVCIAFFEAAYQVGILANQALD